MGLLETSIVAGMIGLLVLDRVNLRRRRAARRVSRPARRSAPKTTSGSGDLARRIERGEVRGADLRALFESGQVKMKRNPAASDQLAIARRLAREFHGTDQNTVLELDPSERQANGSRYAVLVGEVPAIEYQPPSGSKRAGAVYRHESGDRGTGKPTSGRRPLLAVDPITRKPMLVQHRSPMRFSSKRGLVG